MPSVGPVALEITSAYTGRLIRFEIFIRYDYSYFFVVGETGPELVILRIIPVSDVAVGSGNTRCINGFESAASCEHVVKQSSSSQIFQYSVGNCFAGFPITEVLGKFDFF